MDFVPSFVFIRQDNQLLIGWKEERSQQDDSQAMGTLEKIAIY